MGDFRASCQIKFKCLGVERELNLGSVNWYPHDYGADRRVLDFFEEAWEAVRDKYNKEQEEAEERARAPALEKKEREELARLKAKYEKSS